MTRVRFLDPREIEYAAQRVLAAYEDQFGEIGSPPIPVDVILEAHLRLTLEFCDMKSCYGGADILGATWIQEKRVEIDHSLDPAENPQREGRFRFTIAHEIGHWVLHRNYYLENESQMTLFGVKATPSVVCRSTQKDPQEWQADLFAGFLLMPKDMLLDAWKNATGEDKPYNAEQEIANMSPRINFSGEYIPTVEIAKKLAKQFLVSGQAMQIRLEKMGLIENVRQDHGIFPTSS